MPAADARSKKQSYEALPPMVKSPFPMGDPSVLNKTVDHHHQQQQHSQEGD